MILVAFLMVMTGSGLVWRGRGVKLLVLRFMPRGLRGLRLEITRSCRISPARCYGTPSCVEGGIAMKAGSLRRTRILSYHLGSPRPEERLGVRAQYDKGEKAWSCLILMHVCF